MTTPKTKSETFLVAMDEASWIRWIREDFWVRAPINVLVGVGQHGIGISYGFSRGSYPA